jgi:uncharacterized cupin superfamily protein
VINQERARALAERWVAAWNAHDLEAVLEHYADDVEFHSPFVVRVLGEESGMVRGLERLREYFGRALEAYPELRFDLHGVSTGVDSIALRYTSVGGLDATELMTLNSEGKVSSVRAHYGSAPGTFVAHNVFADSWDSEQARPGYSWKRMRLGRRIGTELIGASVYELAPGAASFPYHSHNANEELLLVLEGAPSLRTPRGVEQLQPGDAVAFPPGRQGAHQVLNQTEKVARILIASTMISPEIAEYPDSHKVGLFAGGAPGSVRDADGLAGFFRLDEVDYFDDESGPRA